MTTHTDAETKFAVGDKVAFTFGLTRAEGEITEDRGPIGKGGRRLYEIRFSFSEGDPMTIALPAAALERVDHKSR